MSFSVAHLKNIVAFYFETIWSGASSMPFRVRSGHGAATTWRVVAFAIVSETILISLSETKNNLYNYNTCMHLTRK